MTVEESKKTPHPSFWDSVSSYALVVGGMVHDLRNALDPISGYTGLWEMDISTMDIPEEDRREYLHNAAEVFRAIKQCAAIADSLLAISRPFYKDDSDLVLHTNIGQVLADTPRSHFREGTKLAVRFRVRGSIPVLALPRPIFDVIIRELVRNSLEAARRVGRDATLSLSLSYFHEDCLLKIVAKDTGPGFPKEPGDGTPSEQPGTGLFFLREIANRLGGWLAWKNDPRGGARIEVALVAGEGT
ncbi:MAG: hypothetical protein CVU57_08495 [Deltaproteobacteria bacterium HGW-Deltaproteobacteria-15]|jgi:signal transduction histidine kinase|nr:MAG: hypothetical protein CVU57_08495 [Deltaproteobacteria bacterium HGW-Deltaproteobacteria-15]